MSNYIYTPYVSPASELYHHGVKGQKWGERHYQYEDGSLTPEGRKHYGVGERIKAFGQKLSAQAAANRKASEGKGLKVGEVERNAKLRVKVANSDYKLSKQAAKQQRKEDKKNLGTNAAKENYKTNIKNAKHTRDMERDKAADKLAKDYKNVSDASINKRLIMRAAAGAGAMAAGSALYNSGKPAVGVALHAIGASFMAHNLVRTYAAYGEKYLDRYTYV